MKANELTGNEIILIVRDSNAERCRERGFSSFFVGPFEPVHIAGRPWNQMNQAMGWLYKINSGDLGTGLRAEWMVSAVAKRLHPDCLEHNAEEVEEFRKLLDSVKAQAA